MSDTGYTLPPDTTAVYNVLLGRFQEDAVAKKQHFPNRGRKDMRLPPVHPGEVFEEDVRKPLGISQAKAARQMGMSANRLNEIVKGKRGVTAETAVLFGRFSSTSADFWMNMQTQRDLWFAERALVEQIQRLLA